MQKERAQLSLHALFETCKSVCYLLAQICRAIRSKFKTYSAVVSYCLGVKVVNIACGKIVLVGVLFWVWVIACLLVTFINSFARCWVICTKYCSLCTPTKIVPIFILFVASCRYIFRRRRRSSVRNISSSC